MQFRIRKKQNENIHNYPTDDIQIAENFSIKLKQELQDFLVAVVIFGSLARKATTRDSDIDVLVITDDTAFDLTPELVEAYKIITENLIASISAKLHVTSMTFTTFWEYAKAGDPVAINMLRDGVPLHDRGFFEPMQILLKQGRIRPTEESVWRYYGRAPKTIVNSRWHLLQATLDLYWAVVDSAHAALMRVGATPTDPERMPELMTDKLVKTNKLEKKYVATMRKFFDINKQITHRQIKTISGKDYDAYLKEAREFVERMRVVIGKG